jgi:hypothetical protein
MAKTSAGRGRRSPPSAKVKSVKITLSFTDEQVDLLDRAAAKADDNRANWIRRRVLADARADLGIAPPADPAKK